MQYALDNDYTPGVLHNHLGSQRPGVVIEEIKDFQLLQIDLWPEHREAVIEALGALGVSLPSNPCEATTCDAGRVLWIGPDRYWLVADSDSDVPQKLLEAYASADQACCIDLSHSRTRLRLSGVEVRAWLAKGLPIDLHDRDFPENKVISSAIDHVGVTLDRVADDAVFELYVFRGFAVALMDYFKATSAEFGAELK